MHAGDNDKRFGAGLALWRPVRRFKAVRRFVYGVLAVMVGVVVVRIAWGYWAQTRLDALIAEYRSRNQPVFVEDFYAEPDAVAPEHNAALRYEAALNGMVLSLDSGYGVDTAWENQPRLDRDAARRLIEKNADTLRLAHEARDFPDVAWSRGPGSTPIPFLGRVRRLGKLLWLSFRYHLESDDHKAAVHALLNLAAFGDAAGTEPGRLSNIVATSLQGLCFDLVEDHSHHLQIGNSGGGKHPDVVSAEREDVERLLAVLLDERPMREHAARAYWASRAENLHELKSSPQSAWINPAGLGPLGVTPVAQIVNYMANPVRVLDTARTLRTKTAVADAVGRLDWADAKRLEDEEINPPDATLLFRLSRPATFGPFGYRSPASGVRLQFDTTAERRMAALAIAIRLYEVDHGHRPTELAALVPDYLDELPIDPFSPDRSTFLYRPDAERALLYSVWMDGEDHGGQRRTLPNGRRDTERSDLLFYLDPEPDLAENRDSYASPDLDSSDEAGDDE